MNKIITSVFLMISTSILSAQQVIPLYDGEIPNAKPCNEKDHEFIDTSWMKSGILIVDHITKPTLTIFEPAAEKRKRNSCDNLPWWWLWDNCSRSRRCRRCKGF